MPRPASDFRRLPDIAEDLQRAASHDGLVYMDELLSALEAQAVNSLVEKDEYRDICHLQGQVYILRRLRSYLRR